jgi:hypothetical protein
MCFKLISALISHPNASWVHRFPQVLVPFWPDDFRDSGRTPALRVTVYSAKNLPPADVNGKADPYCTMQLVGADFDGFWDLKDSNLNPGETSGVLIDYR